MTDNAAMVPANSWTIFNHGAWQRRKSHDQSPVRSCSYGALRRSYNVLQFYVGDAALRCARAQKLLAQQRRNGSLGGRRLGRQSQFQFLQQHLLLGLGFGVTRHDQPASVAGRQADFQHLDRRELFQNRFGAQARRQRPQQYRS